MDEERREYYALHLKTKLDVLIAHDVNMETFGADYQGAGHQFKLRTPLPEETIAEFEAKFTVRLPEDYRAFLKCVGNGGAGPGYGMAPLSSGVDKDTGKYGDRYLATPFDYTQPLGVNPDDALPFEDEGGGRYHGCLYLADHGCGIYDFMIVTGPCRGQIWTDDRCNDGGVRPTAASFGAWYDQWLDRAFLELYSRKLAATQYVIFAIPSPQRLKQFVVFLERLKADELAGGVNADDSVYLDYFDDSARAHFWFPTEAERRSFQERRDAIWNATPSEERYAHPDLKYPREFKHTIANLGRAKIQFGECGMVSAGQAKLAYFEPGNVFWPNENLFSIMESFGFTLMETGDGRGRRPEPRSRNVDL